MLFKEINQKYTEKVSEYLGKGLTINTATMEGSQGEIAKIDLTDGKDVYRIQLEKFHDYGIDTEDHRDYEGFQIIVGKCGDKEVKPNSASTWATLWSDHMEIVESEKLFQIGLDSDYYGSREEAAAAYDKGLARYRAKGLRGCTRKDITSEKTVAVVVPMIMKLRGVSRVNRKEISIWKRTGMDGKHSYTVDYYGDTYALS